MRSVNSKLNFLLLLGIICSPGLFSQELTPTVIGSAGESRDIGQYNVSWTVGESAILTLENQGISMLQGFHQADYFFDVKIIETDLNHEYGMYPNPTDEVLKFKLPDKGMVYSVECFDVSGKILLKQDIDLIHNYIILKEFTPGVYLLRLKDIQGRLLLNGLLVKI